MQRFISASRFLCALAIVGALSASLSQTACADELAGERIYTSKCVACHGVHGEGSKKHKEPLAGSRSLPQLAEFIAKSMPEEEPGTLSKPDAEAVAGYVYNAFYSAIAQQRNAPARIELARLTVRQYRNAVTDLVGSFRGGPERKNERGLKAEYFDSRHFDDGKRVLERLDPQVSFNFGEESPVKGKIDPHEFAIRWRGSLRATETGEYEISLRTDQAGRLWLNDDRDPLVDAWVKSGNDTEHHATLFLLAGRTYPLRLEFAKAKQGVEDGKDKKNKPGHAEIALWWKRPGGVAEAIPARQLAPGWSPDGFVCTTPFPPDDRSYGWERGASVSKEWDEATTDAALQTAAYVVDHLHDLSGVPDDAGDRKQRLQAFCHTLAERAVRRPLTAEQTHVLIDKQFAAAKDPETAVRRVVLATLASPWFLYRELAGAHNSGADSYDVASRLSFGLWDSLPDQQLLSTAAANQLGKREQIVSQAQRMLGDPRANVKLRQFLMTWVKADQAGELTKDGTKFPGFDAALAVDLRTSLELFFDDVIASDRADFRQLLLADYVFLNGRLAKFYGANLPADADFTPTKLDADRRAGVLTHPFLMSNFAHYKESSPILRGVFLARGVLALSLRPPPEAVAPLAPELQPSLTTRERVALQTKADVCMRCHGIINPLGYTLEHFDAVGRYRGEDNGKPVDASGSYLTRGGKRVTVRDARELANFLVDSEEAQSAFVEQLFHFLVQQPVQAYGPKTLENLRQSFKSQDFNIRKLAVEILATSALKARE